VAPSQSDDDACALRRLGFCPGRMNTAVVGRTDAQRGSCRAAA
jgi:hypothetical protein